MHEQQQLVSFGFVINKGIKKVEVLVVVFCRCLLTFLVQQIEGDVFILVALRKSSSDHLY